MAWYHELDYDVNPFTEDTRLFADKAVALDDQFDDVVYYIQSGSMVFVEGKKGSGKSILTSKLINKFRGRKRLIYLDMEKAEKKTNIEVLMQERYGLLGRVFSMIPKNMILLLDNVKPLSKRNAEMVKYYFDNNYLASVLFTGENYVSAGLSRGIRDRIGTRVIKLKELSEDDAVELVRRRLGTLNFLTEALAKKIYKHSGRNASKFLQNCEKVSETAVSAGDNKVNENHLKSSLGI